MATESQLLNGIRIKLEQLIVERNALREKVNELINENKNLKTIVNNKNGNHETVEYGKSIEEERLKQLKEAVKQLDQYTRELDECIQWIENN